MTNPWDRYRQERRENHIEIKLAEVGLPEFYVKIRRPGSYTALEVQELIKKASEAIDEISKEDIGIPIILAINGFAYFIADWNLTYFNEPDKRLPLPSEDLRVLAHIPPEVQWYIWKQIDMAAEDIIPPKVRGTLSISG